VEIHSRLNENDRAINLLNQAYEARDHQMAQLKVNPAFDSLRSDPHFAELLRLMNLSPYLPNSISAVASSIH
jgi:hypothetical protein